jgi:hypothetical protein
LLIACNVFDGATLGIVMPCVIPRCFPATTTW